MEKNELNENNIIDTKLPLPLTLRILAVLGLCYGIIMSFYWGFTDVSYYSGRVDYFQLDGDFNAGIFFICVITSVITFCIMLGFAKIVEAADKYLKQ